MGKIVIVEGPDGAGKTTLVEKMVAYLREKCSTVALRNHGAYIGETDISHHYLESIELAADFDFVIMDRCWVSEPIYAQVMRNGNNRLQWQDYRYLCGQANRFIAQIIYCIPPLDNCLEAWRFRRKIEYVDKSSKMVNVYSLYHTSFNEMYMMPKRIYNWVLDPEATIIERVFK